MSRKIGYSTPKSHCWYLLIIQHENGNRSWPPCQHRRLQGRNWEKNGKMGVSGHICLYVACYDFILGFNVSSLVLMFFQVGFWGVILMLKWCVDVWIRWGGQLFRLLGFYVCVWVGDYFIIYFVKILWINHLCFPLSYSIPPVFNHSHLC